MNGEDKIGDKTESIVDLNDVEDAEDAEDECASERMNAKYPADCYSFLTLHSPFERPMFFAFGVLVWLFQMLFLFLMVLRVAGGKRLSENEDMDNPDNGFFSYFIPSNVSSLSRMTQFLALLSYCVFADESLKDIVKAVETFPNFAKAKPEDKVGWMVFSCALRFSQGVLATVVVLLLVIQTQDVIDIILNFTAVNFISGFDDIAFELAQWGKYGPVFKAEANRIEDLTVPDCIYRRHNHVRYSCTILPIALVLIVLASSIAIGQDSDKVWLTQRLRVQFQDGSVFEDYSGCYELDRETSSRMRKRENYPSFGANTQSAQFGYCHDDRKWLLYEGNASSACEVLEEDKIAYSTKTYNFDISMSFEELWYSSNGKPLQLYFFEEEDSLTEGQCSSFLGDGICNSYFNLPEYDYDEGDCCAVSCSGTNCGVGTLIKAFGTEIANGNGFPACEDPVMKPITILLTNVFTTGSAMQPSASVVEDTKEPSLIIDCDGENVLMVSINDSMVNQTETFMVADGANCILLLRNRTIGNTPIFFAEYEIYHGDKESILSNPILMTQGNSFIESVTYFQKIEDCFLTKLEEHIDTRTVYTGSEPANKAIRWLMKDSKYSSCERSDFLERFALTAVNFAAPVEDEANDEGLWITPGRHCIWRAVGCTGSVVTELNYNALTGNFSGSIASEIGILRNITAIDFDSSNLSGTIPTEIGFLSALTNLGIYDNNLVSTIPSEIGLLTDLKSLVINENRLNGSIPSEIGLMTSLTLIGIYSNEITGSIPSEIGELKSISNLVVDGNFLTGSLPTTIGSLEKLNYFGLAYNSITGPIPTELGKIDTLEHIVFDENSLSGSVPSEILALDLISLNVYGNNLSNLIPIDGNVVCKAPGPDLGEHYCDCKNQCVNDIYEPDRCACEDAQACCTEFLGQYELCMVCDGPFLEPNKFVPELLATCFQFARFVLKGVEQFGEASSCREISGFAQAAGCRCTGGLPFDECQICEHGVANPDFFISSVGATCKEAHKIVKQDVASYGTPELCNQARVTAAEFGCTCKADSSDLEEESDLEDEPEAVTECVVCPFGLENPSMFVLEFQASCQDSIDFTRLNVDAYKDKALCDESKAYAEAAGCICLPNSSDLEDESDAPLDLEEYTACVVCPNGELEDPLFFVEDQQASCLDLRTLVEEDISTYGTISVCNQTRSDLFEAGCRCKNDETDFEGTSDSFEV